MSYNQTGGMMTPDSLINSDQLDQLNRVERLNEQLKYYLSLPAVEQRFLQLAALLTSSLVPKGGGFLAMQLYAVYSQDYYVQ